jgi:hypothetical protein
MAAWVGKQWEIGGKLRIEHTRRPLYSIQREFFLGSVTSSPAMVACNVEGGIARSPLPTRIAWFFLGVGMEEESMMSPGRTIVCCCVAILRTGSLICNNPVKSERFPGLVIVPSSTSHDGNLR